ncbi:MAG: hypothetical protein K0S61_4005 [Anaerocolumna sp.]|jgi:Zn finger protein HypA/HybF involved in hydrogenase expression|nr:hypothetical protein [Anaerocolumna sp.]
MGVFDEFKKAWNEGAREGRVKGKQVGSLEYHKQKYEEEKLAKKAEKERVQQFKEEHIPFCPKCKSTSLTYLDKRKKLSLGRAVVGGVIGGALTGGLGAAAGATMGGLSSNKIKKGKVKCLNCGHTWKL